MSRSGTDTMSRSGTDTIQAFSNSSYVPLIGAPNGVGVCYEIRIRDLDLADYVHVCVCVRFYVTVGHS